MAHKYDPDYSVHPGETVKECMEMYKQTPHDVAKKFGNSNTAVHVTNRLCGEIIEISLGFRSIEQKHAFAFAIAFNMPSHFWEERQARYDQYWKDWRKFQDAYRASGVMSKTQARLTERNLSTNPDPE